MCCATSVPFGDTFLLVGGSDDTYQKTIYEFDPVGMDWLLRPEELKEERDAAFAVTTSAEYMGCY